MAAETADERQLAIWNLALRKIGAKKLTSLTDGSPNQLVLTDVYPYVRDAFLCEALWTFAQRRYELLNFTEPEETADDWVTATAYVVGDYVVSSSLTYVCLTAHTSGTFATDLAASKWMLTIDSDDIPMTEDGMDTAYLVPSGLLKINFISDPTARYSVENLLVAETATQVILSDTRGLKIIYTYQNTDLRTYYPMSLEALATRLAHEICFNLTESKSKQDALLEEYEKVRLPRAISSDSQQGSPPQAIQNEWENSRLSGSNVLFPGSGVWHPAV